MVTCATVAAASVPAAPRAASLPAMPVQQTCWVRVTLACGATVEREWISVSACVAEYPWPLATRWEVMARVGRSGERRTENQDSGEVMARKSNTYRANRGPNTVMRPLRAWVGNESIQGKGSGNAAGMDTATAKAALRGAGSGKSRRPFARDLVQRASNALWLRPAVQDALMEQMLCALWPRAAL